MGNTKCPTRGYRYTEERMKGKPDPLFLPGVHSSPGPAPGRAFTVAAQQPRHRENGRISGLKTNGQ